MGASSAQHNMSIGIESPDSGAAFVCVSAGRRAVASVSPGSRTQSLPSRFTEKRPQWWLIGCVCVRRWGKTKRRCSESKWTDCPCGLSSGTSASRRWPFTPCWSDCRRTKPDFAPWFWSSVFRTAQTSSSRSSAPTTQVSGLRYNLN